MVDKNPQFLFLNCFKNPQNFQNSFQPIDYFLTLDCLRERFWELPMNCESKILDRSLFYFKNKKKSMCGVYKVHVFLLVRFCKVFSQV